MISSTAPSGRVTSPLTQVSSPVGSAACRSTSALSSAGVRPPVGASNSSIAPIQRSTPSSPSRWSRNRKAAWMPDVLGAPRGSAGATDGRRGAAGSRPTTCSRASPRGRTGRRRPSASSTSSRAASRRGTPTSHPVAVRVRASAAPPGAAPGCPRTTGRTRAPPAPWLQLPRHLRVHPLDVLADVVDDPVVERACDDCLRDAIAGAGPPFPELGAGVVEPVATEAEHPAPPS